MAAGGNSAIPPDVNADADINIEYAYCATSPNAKNGLLVLRASNCKKALKVLNT